MAGRIAVDMKQAIAFIESDVREATMETGEELLDIFITKYVDVYAYGGAVTGEWYTPTGQFRAAWRHKNQQIAPYMWETKLYYNPRGVMHEKPERWQHYSNFSDGGSSVENLDEILNVQGSTAQKIIWNNRKRAYFDAFILDYVDSGKAKRMLERNIKNS